MSKSRSIFADGKSLATVACDDPARDAKLNAAASQAMLDAMRGGSPLPEITTEDFDDDRDAQDAREKSKAAKLAAKEKK